MMMAAKEAAGKGAGRPRVIGVTLLTSMKQDDMDEVGLKDDPATCVLRLAKLAKASGLDGIVSSGQEVAALRQELGQEFDLVTPGIRLSEGNKDDQARIVTPEMAIQAGSDYLVVGRPITSAHDPMVALQDFNKRAGKYPS